MRIDQMKKILVLNGPNLNLLGLREPAIYGHQTYQDLETSIQDHCQEKGIQVEIKQTNHEGSLVDYIHQAYFDQVDGIIINPAAYTHTSVAILDAVKAVTIPTVEVHLSDTNQREDFRKTSYIRSACIKTIEGKGINGYIEAIDFLSNL